MVFGLFLDSLLGCGLGSCGLVCYFARAVRTWELDIFLCTPVSGSLSGVCVAAEVPLTTISEVSRRTGCATDIQGVLDAARGSEDAARTDPENTKAILHQAFRGELEKLQSRARSVYHKSSGHSCP